MKKEHQELIKKHAAEVMPKLQEVLTNGPLKDFSINQLHLNFGIGGCPQCPPGQTCPWVDNLGVVHFDSCG